MTVKELKNLLEDAPDEMMVIIPAGEDFDGFFYSPCLEESGIAEMGVNENLKTTENAFALVRCGFLEGDHEGSRQKELN